MARAWWVLHPEQEGPGMKKYQPDTVVATQRQLNPPLPGPPSEAAGTMGSARCWLQGSVLD